MADFAAILKKTLDKMGETTPDMRAQVYQRARETVQRQIDAMATRPPQAAIDRQFAKLDDAIAGIEAELAPAAAPPARDTAAAVEEEPAPATTQADPEPQAMPDAPAPDAPAPDAPGPDEPTVDDVLASLEAASDRVEPHSDEPFGTPDAEPDPPAPEPPVMPRAQADDPLLDFLNEQRATMSEDGGGAGAEADRAADMLFGEAGETVGTPVSQPADTGAMAAQDADTLAGQAGGVPPLDPARRSRRGRLAAIVLVLGLVGGGGYAAYMNQTPIRAFLSGYGIELPMPPGAEDAANVADEQGVPVRTVETTAVDGPDRTDAPETGQGTVGAPVDTVNAAGTDEDVQKFTQRLTEDGREVDEGPADGAAGTGEGSTVAGQTVPGRAPVPGAGATAPGTDEAGASDAAVGQRAIFYEERTGTQPGTANQGSTVWSMAQVSPGGDLPVEPAIRAEATVPELDLTLEMTIRRNGDATFPASHIVELFFTVSETFQGRGIADVQRITFKNTEQDPGSALIAVPAPIDTNIFLVALTDAATAVQTNTALMLSQGWIDIPMQYVSGRRALITLEKGAAGDRVFSEVFDAWDSTPLGGTGGG